MSSVAPSPPEQGQLVSVRSRQWIVNDVRPSTLPPDRLQIGLESPQHLITLSSVEDDGLGEELQVIQEIEPGAKVIEKVALPELTGFDPPDKLDAFLDAVRWGAAFTADVKIIQAPFRSGIDSEDDSSWLFAFEEPLAESRDVRGVANEAGQEITFAKAKEIVAEAKKKRRPRRQKAVPTDKLGL
jgi:hypothetical protein